MNQTDFPEVEESQQSESEKLLEQIKEQLAQVRQEFQEILMLHEQSEL